MTVLNGIFQGDIIIRSALLKGIADLRANPFLLDYVFASLIKDDLTKAVYGQAEIEKAKKWFLRTRIPVMLSTRMGEAKLPAISITLMESTEAEATLGDMHYEVSETYRPRWEDLTAKFKVEGYTASTGTVVLPETIVEELVVVPGMFLVDAVGKIHEILDQVNDTTFLIQEGTVADFSKTTVRAGSEGNKVTLEHVRMTESYGIGCHVDGDQNHLIYLHSIVSFILLRYKEALFEARGFGESKISSTDVKLNFAGEDGSSIVGFSRYLKITGKVIHSWPKVFGVPVLKVDDSGVEVESEPWNAPNSLLWIEE